MGRSKKGPSGGGGPKLLCYWCEKEFTEEQGLIVHQLAKHFRCPECRSGNAGKCINLECLVAHFRKLHHAELLTVPNSIEGRQDPLESQHIYGMAGVPEHVVAEWSKRFGAPIMTNPVDDAPTENPPLPSPMPAAPLPPMPIGLPPGLPPGMPPGLPPGLPLGLPPLPTGLPPLPDGMVFPAFPGTSAGDIAQDWSQQVSEWMNKNKPVVEEEPPPIPEPEPPPVHHNGFSGPLPTDQSLDLPGLSAVPKFGGSEPPSTKHQTDSHAAANAIAQAAEVARLAAQSAPPSGPLSFSVGSKQPQDAQLEAAFGPRSDRSPNRRRSRWSRSRSRSQPPEQRQVWEAPVAPAKELWRPTPISEASHAAPKAPGGWMISTGPGYAQNNNSNASNTSRMMISTGPGYAQNPSANNNSMMISTGPGYAQSPSSNNNPRTNESSNSSSKPAYSAEADRQSTQSSQPKQIDNSEGNRAIQILSGNVRSRLVLKKEMERFGRVEVCYMGNRNDPSGDPPMVRFAQSSSAEAALQALNTGQVLFDGGPVTAEFKRAANRPQTTRRDDRSDRDRNLDATSRDIARESFDRRDRGDRGGRGDGRGDGRGEDRRRSERDWDSSSRDLIREERRDSGRDRRDDRRR